MSEYTDEIERIRNKSNLSTKKLERELVKHYYQASERYKEELKNVKPRSMKEAWLHNQRKAISRYMTKVSEEQEGIINKQMQSVIDEINTSTEKYFNKAAAAGGLPDDLFDGMYTSMNDKVLREVLSGNLYKDGLGLSSRLWKNNSNFDKSIQNVITEGLTDKLSVYDIAKNLEGYVDPEQRKYSKYPKSGKGKNVEYNSYRLANTSVTHAYQMALSRVNKTNPFINGIEWVGGRNHNSCELCKSRNGKVYEAKRNQGVKFTTEALPLDHPNGFCNNIPYIPDDLEHIGDRLGKWARGEESDPELDDWFDKHGKKYVSAKDIQKAMGATQKNKNPFKQIEDQYGIKIDVDEDMMWILDKLDMNDFSVYFEDLFSHEVKMDIRIVNDMFMGKSYIENGKLYFNFDEILEMIGGKSKFLYKDVKWDIADIFLEANELLEKLAKKNRTDSIDIRFKGLKDKLPDHIWKDIRKHIEKAPPYVQDWWAAGSKYFKYDGTDGDRAFYSPSSKGITMDLLKELNNRKGSYTTFFHEFGHLIDHQVGGGSPDSRSMAFYRAIEKDYKRVLRSQVPDTMWEEKPDVALELAKRRLTSKLKSASDSISGISDIIGGLTNNEVIGRWGHSKEYWVRGNRKYEITSEMWAHMSACYANDINYNLMKEYFPKALEEFEDMMKRQLEYENK